MPTIMSGLFYSTKLKNCNFFLPKGLEVYMDYFQRKGRGGGWMDELGFYVPSTVCQSFRDDGRVNMKGSVQ